MRHHRVPRIPKKTDIPPLNIRIRLMHPKPPRLNLFSNGQMAKHLPIKRRIRCQKFIRAATLCTPALVRIVSLLARKEAIVREELAAVTRGEDNFVPFAFLAAPVFKCAILGVVDEAGLDGFFGCDVGVEAALVGGFLFRADS